MNKIISDHENEDRGYNRGHRQTRGGEQAYERGEKPLTYWQKQHVINRILFSLNKMRTNPDLHRKLTRLLRDKNLDMTIIEKQLKKVKADILRSEFLEFTGTHYTGNYYRYTKFFNVVEDEKLLAKLRKNLIPRVFEQLKLEGIS